MEIIPKNSRCILAREIGWFAVRISEGKKIIRTLKMSPKSGRVRKKRSTTEMGGA